MDDGSGWSQEENGVVGDRGVHFFCVKSIVPADAYDLSRMKNVA
jgi:hypothetical protein